MVDEETNRMLARYKGTIDFQFLSRLFEEKKLTYDWMRNDIYLGNQAVYMDGGDFQEILADNRLSFQEICSAGLVIDCLTLGFEITIITRENVPDISERDLDRWRIVASRYTNDIGELIVKNIKG